MQMIYLQFTVTGIKVGGVSLKIFLITIIYFLTYELIISNQFLEVCISVPWYLYSHLTSDSIKHEHCSYHIQHIGGEEERIHKKKHNKYTQWLYKESNQTPVYIEKDGSILTYKDTYCLFYW